MPRPILRKIGDELAFKNHFTGPLFVFFALTRLVGGLEAARLSLLGCTVVHRCPTELRLIRSGFRWHKFDADGVFALAHDRAHGSDGNPHRRGNFPIVKQHRKFLFVDFLR